MERRLVLKQLALLTGSLIVAPACRFDSEKVSQVLTNLNISRKEAKLLSAITETIIPATDTPGAIELKIPEFVLLMIDDCREKADQTGFLVGLKQFDPFVKNRYAKSFQEASIPEREAILLENLEAGQFRTFLSLTRELTIQGYVTSEFVLTQIFPYELVPGRFNGCADLILDTDT